MIRVLVLIGMLVGCGPSARQVQINTMLSGLSTTSDAFVAWDVAHQRQILDKAATLEEGQKTIAAYREIQAKVVAALKDAYTALGTAKILNDAHTISNALAAFTIALKAWEDIQK